MAPEKSEEVQRVHDVMLKAMDQEIWRMAELMVTRRDDQLFGRTEFEVREMVLGIGAKAVQTAADGRKKRGTKGAAWFAANAAQMPASSSGGKRRT
jgi:hypothetical protein